MSDSQFANTNGSMPTNPVAVEPNPQPSDHKVKLFTVSGGKHNHNRCELRPDHFVCTCSGLAHQFYFRDFSVTRRIDGIPWRDHPLAPIIEQAIDGIPWRDHPLAHKIAPIIEQAENNANRAKKEEAARMAEMAEAQRRKYEADRAAALPLFRHDPCLNRQHVPDELWPAYRALQFPNVTVYDNYDYTQQLSEGITKIPADGSIRKIKKLGLPFVEIVQPTRYGPRVTGYAVRYPIDPDEVIEVCKQEATS